MLTHVINNDELGEITIRRLTYDEFREFVRLVKENGDDVTSIDFLVPRCVEKAGKPLFTGPDDPTFKATSFFTLRSLMKSIIDFNTDNLKKS